MKKIFAGVIVAGFSLGAFAGPVQAAGHGDNNGVRCSTLGPLETSTNVVDNPAAMFAYYSERGNPVDAVSETYTNNHDNNVGQWIKDRCAAGK